MAAQQETTITITITTNDACPDGLLRIDVRGLECTRASLSGICGVPMADGTRADWLVTVKPDGNTAVERMRRAELRAEVQATA